MRSIRSALLATAALLATSSTVTRAQPAPQSKLTMLGTAQPSQQVEFDVILPLRNAAALDTLLSQQQTPGSSQYHQWLTPQQFSNSFGPDPSIMNTAAAALRHFGMQVTVQSRSLHVVATVSEVNAAFNATLAWAATASGQQRVVAGKPLVVPSSLSTLGVIISAFSASGFDASPLVRQRAAGYVRLSAARERRPPQQSHPARRDV